jgi:hypothetical protein
MGELSRRAIAIAVAAFALALGACIIGPKQDDPAPTGLSDDSGAAIADTTAGGGDAAEDNDGGKYADSSIADTAPAPADTAGPALDAAVDTGCVTDGDAACDSGSSDSGASDAVSDAMDGG